MFTEADALPRSIYEHRGDILPFNRARSELEPFSDAVRDLNRKDGIDDEIIFLHKFAVSSMFDFRQSDHTPRLPLTRAIIELASYPSESLPNEVFCDDISDDTLIDRIGCLQAEPRLIYSLGDSNPGRPDGTSAMIYRDVHGKPVGYRKDYGVRSIFFWETAEIETENGNRMVPGNSFVAVQYAKDTDPTKQSPGKRVIAPFEPRPPKELALIRFSNTLLSPVIRQAATIEGIKQSEIIATQAFAEKITAFTAQDIARIACGLAGIAR